VKKRLSKVRESIALESAYNSPNLETGTSYSPGLGRQYMPVAMESPRFR